jgi:uncharacterized integral membrane protein
MSLLHETGGFVPDDTNTPKQPGAQVTPESAASRADQEQMHRLQRDRQTRVAKAIALLVILGVLIAFIVANSQSVTVHFVFFTRRPALIWVMFACALLGAILGYLIGRPARRTRLPRTRSQPPGR